ncbi:maintenance of mitochondrial morphology protein 1 [Pisolithus croceorrhizus]|nr:maintenance of mitochondrial morphology protein 1 [Pisolithus croceorrhizus]
MGSNYIFSLTPTFTQGLILGQLSILALLALVLKYLFFISPIEQSDAQSLHPRTIPDYPSWSHTPKVEEDGTHEASIESAAWFNSLARQVIDVYRAKLQNGLTGLEGIEVARQRIEAYANTIRPRNFFDHITVHAVDLGNSAPQLSNAQMVDASEVHHALPYVKFDMSYSDTISVSLSTTYLLNYPMSSFARLPVSLTISLSRFESSIVLSAPSPADAIPALSISLPPDFTLRLKTTSLMGSRAMLKDVPKLHDLIENQVRRVLVAQGVWKVVLPGAANVSEVKAAMQNDVPVEAPS